MKTFTPGEFRRLPVTPLALPHTVGACWLVRGGMADQQKGKLEHGQVVYYMTLVNKRTVSKYKATIYRAEKVQY